MGIDLIREDCSINEREGGERNGYYLTEEFRDFFKSISLIPLIPDFKQGLKERANRIVPF